MTSHSTSDLSQQDGRENRNVAVKCDGKTQGASICLWPVHWPVRSGRLLGHQAEAINNADSAESMRAILVETRRSDRARQMVPEKGNHRDEARPIEMSASNPFESVS
ncbi:unnamed protein product [Protopolystoma xenopodis]|uniref:Uncharacterized protein n=1 Tax=Protopolystoma xenopodis TaxID=117903 RepID=A0A3S5CEW5_9PLAT|nr:unnamed protein product [Protopolystoma xenopodis]